MTSSLARRGHGCPAPGPVRLRLGPVPDSKCLPTPQRPRRWPRPAARPLEVCLPTPAPGCAPRLATPPPRSFLVCAAPSAPPAGAPRRPRVKAARHTENRPTDRGSSRRASAHSTPSVAASPDSRGRRCRFLPRPTRRRPHSVGLFDLRPRSNSTVEGAKASTRSASGRGSGRRARAPVVQDAPAADEDRHAADPPEFLESLVDVPRQDERHPE